MFPLAALCLLAAFSLGWYAGRRPRRNHAAPYPREGERWIFRDRVCHVDSVWRALGEVWLRDGWHGRSVAVDVLREEGRPYTDDAWQELQDRKAAEAEVDHALKARR